MKYIKLFEDNYYTRLSEDEYNNYFDIGVSYPDTILNFTGYEKDLLRDILSEQLILNITDYNNELRFRMNESIFSIFKLADEWYLVNVRKERKVGMIGFMGETPLYKYYKCDQMEGLKEFIKSIYI